MTLAHVFQNNWLHSQMKCESNTRNIKHPLKRNKWPLVERRVPEKSRYCIWCERFHKMSSPLIQPVKLHRCQEPQWYCVNAGAGASALCECVSLCDCIFCVARVCAGMRVPLLSVSHCALSSSSRTADWIRLAWIIPNSQCSTEFLHRADHSFTFHFLNTRAAQKPNNCYLFQH